MKYTKLLILFCLCVFSNQIIYADTNTIECDSNNLDLSNRMYINKDAISIQEDGLFLT